MIDTNELRRVTEQAVEDDPYTAACHISDACDELEKLYAELKASREEGERLRASIATIRDAVVYERYQLADAGLNSDQLNSVLGIIDDNTIT